MVDRVYLQVSKSSVETLSLSYMEKGMMVGMTDTYRIGRIRENVNELGIYTVYMHKTDVDLGIDGMEAEIKLEVVFKKRG